MKLTEIQILFKLAFDWLKGFSFETRVYFNLKFSNKFDQIVIIVMPKPVKIFVVRESGNQSATDSTNGVPCSTSELLTIGTLKYGVFIV